MSSSSHGRSRPSYLAAPPLTDGDAAEGSFILSEVAAPLGVLLWEAYRDTMAWIKTPGERRPRLFAEGALQWRRIEINREVGPERIRGTLLSLAAILDGQRDTSPDDVLQACQALATWADDCGNPATRFAFTQLAALADPTTAKLALETGKQARDLAEYPCAETWLRKAVRVARRTKDWDSYLWSYAALAILYARLGNYPASRTLAERVLKAARHHRETGMQGWASHHFFILAADSNQIREAYEHARAALKAYGASHIRLTALAHDVARFWVEHGQFARALSVFETVLPKISEVEEQAVVAANVARAAAGAGEHEKYSKARLLATMLQKRVCGEARAAEIFATLAIADALAGQWALADETADCALDIAARQRNSEVPDRLESAMRAAREMGTTESMPRAELPTLARQAERLADALIETLGAGAGSS
jgi:tetratricopeptide (TPR) repeat protein